MVKAQIIRELEYIAKDVEQEQLLKIRQHKYHEHPKVSVIVPVYKVDKYLTKCLNSIVNQTLEELEIIIVDEGDVDRCREIIDYFEKNDPRVVAPHKKNGGYGASCNLGFDMARGEYIAIVESDDFIEPEMYEEMYEYALKLDADVVKTPYYEYTGDGTKRDCCYRNYVTDACPQNMCFSVKEYGVLLEVHASLWSGLYRTSYMKKNNIQFIRAKGGAYVDVGFRIDTLVNTDKCAWLNKPYYNYRVDSEGSTTNNFKLKPMLYRWKEVHEKFKEKQKDYDKYYGKHLIIDEYYNTLGWISLIPMTDEECQLMQDNFALVKEEVIQNSPILNKKQKKELLMFKASPRKFQNYARKERFSHKYGNKIMRMLNGASNPVLLFFIMALMITSFVSQAAMELGYIKIALEYSILFSILGYISLIGVALCFLAKVIRKIVKFCYNK